MGKLPTCDKLFLHFITENAEVNANLFVDILQTRLNNAAAHLSTC